MYLSIPNNFFVNICYAEEDIFDIKNIIMLKDKNYKKFIINEYRKQIVIGVALPTQREAKWVNDKNNMEKYATAKGAILKIKNADTDSEKQALQVEELIKEGIDVLVLAPVNSKEAAKIVERAHMAGIKVIGYDRLTLDSDLDLYISFDGLRVGELQGRFLVEKVLKGNYIILSGDPNDNNSILLKEGAMKFISPLVNKGDIKIVTEEAINNWEPQNAYNIVKNSLRVNKVDAILAPNDATAGGVIKALDEKGLAGKVFVTGQDADIEAAQRIVQGTQAMTVFKDNKKIAQLAIDSAIKLANGEGIDVSGTVNNGKINVPFMNVTSILVDKNNIQQVLIDSGYFSKSEVYKHSMK